MPESGHAALNQPIGKLGIGLGRRPVIQSHRSPGISAQSDIQLKRQLPEEGQSKLLCLGRHTL